VLALVEDDVALRQALAFRFTMAGYRVAEFADAESALAAADRRQWRCLIVDLHLPGMSGLDLLDALQRGSVRAPALLVTSNPSPATRERARAANVEIVEKPLIDEALARKVRQHMDA
jgi:two-component system, LuxR family, response regulator FixJ